MRARGFTLTELSIALAVLGLLLAVALPAWSHVRGAAQARAAEGALLESLLRAGGRAAITGRRAVLCASRDGEGCSGSSDWSRGWIAFHDSMPTAIAMRANRC